LSLSLAPGAYLWRVTAIAPGDVRSAASPPRRLLVNGPAVAVAVGPSTHNPDTKIEKDLPKKPEADTPASSGSIAPRVGVVTNFGGVTAPRFGIGVGYRLPILGGVMHVVLHGGYYTAELGLWQDDMRVWARLHGFPLELVAQFEWPPELLSGFDWLQFVVGVGAVTTFSYVTTTIDGQTLRHSGGVMQGAVVTLAAQKRVGIGDLFVELAVLVSSHFGDGFVYDPGGLTATAGYRIFVF
jgi:hypothetical protein